MAVAALNKVYGIDKYPLIGPRPIKNSTKTNGNGTKDVKIVFTDGTFTYKPIENSGFYACTLSSDMECDNKRGSWTLVSLISCIELP